MIKSKNTTEKFHDMTAATSSSYETLGKFDMLFYEGVTAMDHEGNIRLKKLIKSFEIEYKNAESRIAKTNIINGIIRMVREYG